MPKKKLEENTPMKSKKTTDATQPAAENDPTMEQTVPAPKVRKSTKKKDAFKPEVPEQVEEVSSAPEGDLPPKKSKRGGWILLGILIMLLITAAGAAIGYSSAIKVRRAEESNQRLIVATTQFELSLQNIKDGKLSLAQRRLQYVIQVYPTFPGAADKLAQVMVSLANTNQSSGSVAAVDIPTVEATKDTRGAAQMLTQAQQYLAAEDWKNLYASVNSLRNLDPTYEAVKVDGLFYLALRNMGIYNIKAGNLEVGIYQFAVAEQIGPIDKDADSYRQWAKLYVNGYAYWGISGSWQIVVNNFAELYKIVPDMIDYNNISVTKRYAEALDNYGDALESSSDWCNAVTQYQTSITIINDETVSAKLPVATANCANPPATPAPTSTST